MSADDDSREPSTDATLAADSDVASAAKPHAGLELPVRDRARYGPGAEIARGGMGRIVLVHDRELERDIAIKELLSSSPALDRRFEREIQITAQLQHPSIIGVLEAGRWPSGERFFTMKRVEGRAFDKVIANQKTLSERLGLLRNIIAVADALAYAHSQRVIHRDLKPGNVLVGAFGETVVIDWGLAKNLDAREVASDRVAGPDPSGDAALTVMGEAIGTPAYMPPEQARGEAVDERADVYAIGAMLYHVLTGRMPYHDSSPTSAEQLLSQVKDSAPTRLPDLEPDAPADLVTIVQKAMARDPEARYRSAAEVAEDLKRYETGQLVSVHEYSTAALMKRWVKRHRAAVVVAAVMAMALAIGGAVSFVRISNERDEATAQRKEAETQRAEVEELLSFLVSDLRDKLLPMGQLELLEMVARKPAEYYANRPIDWSRPRDPVRRAIAHNNLGDVLRAQGNYDGAIEQYRTSIKIGQRLVEQDPDAGAWQNDLAVAHDRLGYALQTRDLEGAMEQYRASLAIREQLVRQEPDNNEWQRGLASTLQKIGDVRQAQGDLDGAREKYEAVLAVSKRLAEQAPTNSAWQRDLSIAHGRVGSARYVQADRDGALEHFRASLTIGEALLEQAPPNPQLREDIAFTTAMIGTILQDQGDVDGALEQFRAGLATLERLVEHDRTNTEWQRNRAAHSLMVGKALLARGDVGAATSQFQRTAGFYASIPSTAMGAIDYYNATSVYALSNNKDRAFEMLARAIELGWNDSEYLEKDPDLEPLRKDRRWDPLAQKLKAK